jgi:hypothetical protein
LSLSIGGEVYEGTNQWIEEWFRGLVISICLYWLSRNGIIIELEELARMAW